MSLLPPACPSGCVPCEGLRAFHQYSRSTLNNEDMGELVDVSELVDLSGSHSWGNQNLCDSFRNLVAAFSPLTVMSMNTKNELWPTRQCALRCKEVRRNKIQARWSGCHPSNLRSRVRACGSTTGSCGHRFSTCCGELVLQNLIPPSNAL